MAFPRLLARLMGRIPSTPVKLRGIQSPKPRGWASARSRRPSRRLYKCLDCGKCSTPRTIHPTSFGAINHGQGGVTPGRGYCKDGHGCKAPGKPQEGWRVQA